MASLEGNGMQKYFKMSFGKALHPLQKRTKLVILRSNPLNGSFNDGLKEREMVDVELSLPEKELL